MGDDKEQVRAAINYRSYYGKHVQGLKPIGEDQAIGICPFHGDTKTSFSVNTESGLWNCKGCAERGDVFTFHAKINNLGGFKAALIDLASKYDVQIDEDKKKPKTKKKQNQTIDRALADKFHTQLMEAPKALERIERDRGITKETVERFYLGLDKKGRRLIIPVFDEAGQVLNLRRYSSSAENKMLNWKGFGRALIYGLPELESYPLDEDLLICEGEFDRLTLIQAGFNAITHTNGALSFQRTWAPLFKGRRVVLVYDADDGGRKGAEKTAGLLAPVVESLKSVDLSEAGLVEGTPESKDITDLALANPDWPEALRNAIDQAETLDLSSVAGRGAHAASDSRFVSVFEKDGCYWKPKKNTEFPVSNFVLKPTRRIRIEGQEVLDAAVLNGSGPGSSVSLLPYHWSNKGAFKRALGDLGSGYTGTEDDLQELKVLLADKKCPRYLGEPKLGIHKHKKRWVLVATDKTITEDSEIGELIHWSEHAARIKYEAGKMPPATTDDVAQTADALMKFNTPQVVIPILGWMMALPFRARLIEAVPQLRRQFPVLLAWGGKGAGKTRTVEAIILPFYGDYEGPRKIDEMTRFTFIANAHASNMVPLAFDEYKPSKLNPKQTQLVSQFVRSTYDALAGERGRVKQAGGLGIDNFTFTAPAIIMGEQGFVEPALRERVIEVVLSKDARKEYKRIDDYMVLNLPGVGFQYIRWSLGVTDEEVGRVWREEYVAADPVFEDRIRQNVSTARLGIKMWARFLESKGVNINPGEKIDIVDTSQRDALYGDGPRPKSDIDLIIEAFGSMAAMDESLVSEGEDFKKTDDGRLQLKIQTIYPRFKRWAREYEFDGEVLDYPSFRRRLKDESYFVDGRATMNVYKGGLSKNVRVVILDIGGMDAAGVDLSGFGIEEVPF